MSCGAAVNGLSRGVGVGFVCWQLRRGWPAGCSTAPRETLAVPVITAAFKRLAACLRRRDRGHLGLSQVASVSESPAAGVSGRGYRVASVS